MSAGLIQTILLVVTVGLIILFTAKYKVNAFLVLLLAAIFFGFFSFVLTGTPILLSKTADGTTTQGLIDLITGGFGSTLTSIGIVIVLGVIMGYFLEKTGAALVMARAILKLVGKKNAPLAMAISGYVVSIPVFCDSGFVILQALNRSLAQSSGISLAIMLGLLASIPAMLAGWLFATRIGKKIWIDPNAQMSYEDMLKSFKNLPSTFMAFLPIVLPLVLIALNSIAAFPSNPFGTGAIKTVFVFLGNPNIALLIGVFIAAALVRGHADVFGEWTSKAIESSAIILVITAAGGALGMVLRASGVGTYLGTTLAQAHMGILLPFIIAAAIKTAQGSSTVSLVTTSAILFPMLQQLGWTTSPQKALIVLAIGAGAMVVSHANDSYFWVVAKFSDMKVDQAFKLQTLGSLITGIGAFLGVAVLWLIFA